MAVPYKIADFETCKDSQLIKLGPLEHPLSLPGRQWDWHGGVSKKVPVKETRRRAPNHRILKRSDVKVRVSFHDHITGIRH